MSRYLTPCKIGLLALIYVYTDGVVPSSATIPLLSFLASYVLPQIRPDSQHYKDLLSHGCAIPIETFLKSTIAYPSQIPGRSIWDLLLKKLWELDSFDALHFFFHNLSSILQAHDVAQRDEDERDSSSHKHMLLSRRSLLGGFVRRAQLEFTRLQFHDGIALWKDFVIYRMPTLSSWRRRNPGVGYYNFDVNLQSQDGHQALMASCTFGELAKSNATRTMLSIDDLVKLLECQVELMQRTGDRLPQTAKASTHAMTISNPAAPSLSHYILFLDAWRAGDYPSAFEYLHRYFDYTIQTRDRSYYQYALLNLAVLQADFGCFYEAIIAMNEAISTARENDDLPCLNYSLSWLYHFGKAHPAEMENIRKTSVLGTEKEAFSFLKTKAKESQMWSLLGTKLLSEAKFFLSNGDNTAQALENLIKASQVIVSKNVTNAYGSQMVMQSFIYSRLGINCQSWVYSDLFLLCHSEGSPAEELIHCQCSRAHLLAQKGRYEQAFACLDDIDKETMRTLKNKQSYATFRSILKLQRHLHRDELVAAEYIVTRLPKSPMLTLDLHFTITILEIEIHVRKQDFSGALHRLEQLATRLNDNESDIFQRLKVMVLKARIYDRAGTPLKGFSLALRAASMAHKIRLLPLLWEAIGAVGRILTNLEEFGAAVRLLNSIMPQVLECGDCSLAGYMFSCLADGYMGLAGKATSSVLQQKEQLTKALTSIDRSFDEFSRIEDIQGQCEMLAKKATIMHLNGDPVLANDCAAKYLDIKQAAKEQIE